MTEAERWVEAMEITTGQLHAIQWATDTEYAKVWGPGRENPPPGDGWVLNPHAGWPGDPVTHWYRPRPGAVPWRLSDQPYAGGYRHP